MVVPNTVSAVVAVSWRREVELSTLTFLRQASTRGSGPLLSLFAGYDLISNFVGVQIVCVCVCLNCGREGGAKERDEMALLRRQEENETV